MDKNKEMYEKYQAEEKRLAHEADERKIGRAVSLGACAILLATIPFDGVESNDVLLITGAAGSYLLARGFKDSAEQKAKLALQAGFKSDDYNPDIAEFKKMLDD